MTSDMWERHHDAVIMWLDGTMNKVIGRGPIPDVDDQEAFGVWQEQQALRPAPRSLLKLYSREPRPLRRFLGCGMIESLPTSMVQVSGAPPGGKCSDGGSEVF